MYTSITFDESSVLRFQSAFSSMPRVITTPALRMKYSKYANSRLVSDISRSPRITRCDAVSKARLSARSTSRGGVTARRACVQLIERERLAEIVIGTGVKAGNNVLGLIARSQNDDRQSDAFCPQVTQD